MFATEVNSGTRTTLGGAISSLTGLKKFDDLVVHAVDRAGEMLVADRRSGWSGAIARRCLLASLTD
jgi:hypothetical protein